jgi:hypothetical protein
MLEPRRVFGAFVAVSWLAAGVAATAAMAADSAAATADAAVAAQMGGGGSSSSSDTGFSTQWTQRVDATQEAQPHWMTPLVTVTPRLEEEVRYDQVWQKRPNNTDFYNYGNNKGVELIPFSPVEVILGIPGYQEVNSPKGVKEGWADETFLVKYRILSGNEENGNYILSAFLGVSVPTGDPVFTNNTEIWTPTIAAGKGWGTRSQGFDIQSTIGYAIPAANEAILGEPLTWNTAFQVHALNEHFWPEAEITWTHYHDGPDDGKDFVYYTVGAIAGRFPITGRLRLALGAGYEQAVTAFRTFNHAWVISGRVPF